MTVRTTGGSIHPAGSGISYGSLCRCNVIISVISMCNCNKRLNMACRSKVGEYALYALIILDVRTAAADSIETIRVNVLFWGGGGEFLSGLLS